MRALNYPVTEPRHVEDFSYVVHGKQWPCSTRPMPSMTTRGKQRLYIVHQSTAGQKTGGTLKGQF